jgi:hypothetical protein
VNEEHLGGVRSFTAPLGREMPLTDLLGLWVLSCRSLVVRPCASFEAALQHRSTKTTPARHIGESPHALGVRTCPVTHYEAMRCFGLLCFCDYRYRYGLRPPGLGLQALAGRRHRRTSTSHPARLAQSIRIRTQDSVRPPPRFLILNQKGSMRSFQLSPQLPEPPAPSAPLYFRGPRMSDVSAC